VVQVQAISKFCFRPRKNSYRTQEMLQTVEMKLYLVCGSANGSKESGQNVKS
jgi:hypothetical protein